MYKEVSELSGRGVCDQIFGTGCYGRLPVMAQVGWDVRVEKTKRMILPELHTFDTLEGLHLVLEHELLPDTGGLLLADGETEPEAGELVMASTVPFLVPPQNGQRARR